ALASHSGEPGHVAGRAIVGGCRAELAAIAALALGIGHLPVAPGRTVCFPACEPVLFGLAQIAVEDCCVGADMGVAVEDPVSVAGHRHSPHRLCGRSPVSQAIAINRPVSIAIAIRNWNVAEPGPTPPRT